MLNSKETNLSNNSIVFVENQEIDEAKQQLMDINRLSETYQDKEKQYTKEINALQRKFSEYEIIEAKKGELEERSEILEEEIEHLENENQQLKER